MNYKELLEFNDYAMDLTIRMAHHSTAIENNPCDTDHARLEFKKK